MRRNSTRYYQLLGSRPCKATEQKAGQFQLSVNPELVPSYNETVFLYEVLRVGSFRKSFGDQKGQKWWEGQERRSP